MTHERSKAFLMNNQDLRKKVLQDGTYRKYTENRKKAFQNGTLYVNELINEDTGEVEKRENTEAYGVTEEEAKECERIRKAKKNQRERVENHVKFLFESTTCDLFFVTLTFSDDTIKKTKTSTRKQKVRRTLTLCDDYIANVDYGEKNEREHYHAIIALKRDSYEREEDDKGHLSLSVFSKYDYGFINVTEVKRDGKDAERLAKYITKLTLHSVKVSQKYVFTKKGTPYQDFKKLKDDLKTSARTDRGLWKDYEDEMMALSF